MAPALAFDGSVRIKCEMLCEEMGEQFAMLLPQEWIGVGQLLLLDGRQPDFGIRGTSHSVVPRNFPHRKIWWLDIPQFPATFSTQWQRCLPRKHCHFYYPCIWLTCQMTPTAAVESPLMQTWKAGEHCLDVHCRCRSSNQTKLENFNGPFSFALLVHKVCLFSQCQLCLS